MKFTNFRSVEKINMVPKKNTSGPEFSKSGCTVPSWATKLWATNLERNIIKELL
jgi:hypothetical protein